ncbi:MAG: hypothetical protein LBG59_09160 [Candidatus Peribacteria bacterium]|nr:hypothetical protein [Candidatus Peribacteria bacterium]
MDFRAFTNTFNKHLPVSVQHMRLQERDFALQQLHLREKKGRLQLLTK